MNCLCEAVGIALPGNGTILAVDPNREKLYKQAGTQIIQLIEKDIKPLDIINEKSIDNAFALDMAMGGSTNTVLHALAMASEAGIKYGLERINSSWNWFYSWAIYVRGIWWMIYSCGETPDGARI